MRPIGAERYPVPVARPKEFDPDEALERALERFWADGYEATSMQDLTAAMGVGRRSLYDTFGSKHELYLRALDRYGERNALVAPLARPGPVKPLLREVLASVCAEALQDAERRGCFFVNAAIERGARDGEVDRRTRAAFDAVREALATAVARGQSQGEIARGRDPEEVADFLLTVIQGLRVVGKAMPDRERLEAAVDAALAPL